MGCGISVLWISKVTNQKGMYNIIHTHDYFHFAAAMQNENAESEGADYVLKSINCVPPDTLHGGERFEPGGQAINIMFLIHDKTLYKMVESFPFCHVKGEKLHEPLLHSIINLCKEEEVNPELLNVAVEHYLRLVMHDNASLIKNEVVSLHDRCVEYINEHYMDVVTLENVANYIGKSRNYTSTLFNNTMGMSLSEYLNIVRIRKACEMIAYSNISIETVAEKCGFSNAKYFSRIFKSIVGMPPVRYKTSHAVKDCRFEGDYAWIKKPYQEGEETFTYTVNAQKMVRWPSAYEYIEQQLNEN